MIYKEEKRDLFSVDTKSYVLAHCISADVTATRAMGAGIAKIFRRNYKDMAGVISPFLRVGKSIRYEKDGDIIYNMVSKPKVYHKIGLGISKDNYYDNLKKCLIDVKNQMIEHNETKIAMPKIGCGLDRGKWEEVREIIKEVFEDTNFEVLICYI
jgi:hypothetical protein